MGEEKQNTSTGLPCNMENIFLLRRLQSPINGPSVLVDFSPTTNPQVKQIISDTPDRFAATYPVFNQDSHFFTPCFVLGTDKTKTHQNSEAYLNLHLQRRMQLIQEKEILLVAKPSLGNSYCCVCKTGFEDYLTHVTMQKHQELMHGSIYSSRITQICQLFPSPLVVASPSKKQGKWKRIRKVGKKQKCASKLSSCMSLSTIDTGSDNKLRADLL